MFTPTPGNWQTGRDYGAQQPRYPLRATPRDTSGGAQNPWRPSEERAISGPFSLTRFPVQPHPPMQTIVLDRERRESLIGRRQFVYESPPRVMGQINLQMQVPTRGEYSRLTPEQKEALKKLKIEVYDPILKRISRRLNLYYRDLSSISENEKKKEEDEDGKRCAVCLEDFEPKQEVTLTPCNHMFHEDCIVPWVKSNGQCPICRSAI